MSIWYCCCYCFCYCYCLVWFALILINANNSNCKLKISNYTIINYQMINNISYTLYEHLSKYRFANGHFFFFFCVTNKCDARQEMKSHFYFKHQAWIAHFLWSAGIIFAEFNIHSPAGPLLGWRSGSATGVWPCIVYTISYIAYRISRYKVTQLLVSVLAWKVSPVPNPNRILKANKKRKFPS